MTIEQVHLLVNKQFPEWKKAVGDTIQPYVLMEADDICKQLQRTINDLQVCMRFVGVGIGACECVHKEQPWIMYVCMCVYFSLCIVAGAVQDCVGADGSLSS